MNYYLPETLKEAEELKVKHQKSIYMAGGTVVNWKGVPAGPVIDLTGLNLNQIVKNNTGIRFGALVTVQEILENPDSPESLKRAAGAFNSLNIRNMATVGGSLTDRFFVSNLLPVFLSFEAEIEYFEQGGKRRALLREWLDNKKGIILSIFISFKKERIIEVEESRISEMDLSAVVTSAGYFLEEGKITGSVLSLSGLSGRTQLLQKSPDFLNGKEPGKISFEELMKVLSDEVKITGNVKVSARVKLRLIESHLRKIFTGREYR